MGWEGWGAVCHVRELDGGDRVARGRSTCVGVPPGGGGIFELTFVRGAWGADEFLRQFP